MDELSCAAAFVRVALVGEEEILLAKVTTLVLFALVVDAPARFAFDLLLHLIAEELLLAFNLAVHARECLNFTQLLEPVDLNELVRVNGVLLGAPGEHLLHRPQSQGVLGRGDRIAHRVVVINLLLGLL